MAKQVFSKEERHEQAVKEGIKLAKKVGLARVSIGKVAAVLKVTAPLLFHVFGSRVGFHKAIAKTAKAQGVTFPEAEPTVRAARAARQAKVVKPAKKAPVKMVPPKKAKAKPEVVKSKGPKKVAKPAAKAKPVKVVAPKAKPAAKAKANGKVRVPKVIPPALARFPVTVAPTTAEPAAAV